MNTVFMRTILIHAVMIARPREGKKQLADAFQSFQRFFFLLSFSVAGRSTEVGHAGGSCASINSHFVAFVWWGLAEKAAKCNQWLCTSSEELPHPPPSHTHAVHIIMNFWDQRNTSEMFNLDENTFTHITCSQMSWEGRGDMAVCDRGH